jgi:hypothetical protein
MSFNEYLREMTFPARSLGTGIALITFYLLGQLISLAGLLGIWLATMVVPALFRYLVLLAQARARGIEADPPGIEYFSLVGNGWSLFPAIPVALVIWGSYTIGQSYGAGAAGIFTLGMVAIVPAMMAVLVITQSPLQSLNPVALTTLIRECGPGYWWAPVTLLGLPFIAVLLNKVLPAWLHSIVGLYLVFAFYAVTGAVIREKKLMEEVYIDDPVEPEVEVQIANLEKERVFNLNHAYGLVSRGNRDGGLAHIYQWLQTDPDPDKAWDWFFDRMMAWEESRHALFYAQQYLPRLLAQNDPIKACKLILRCRLVDETFRPLPEDMQAAIEATEDCGNRELANALKRL